MEERQERSTTEMLNKLREEAPNDQVELLLDTIGTVDEERRRAEARIRRLETRLQRAEDHLGISEKTELGDIPTVFDRRDRSVLEVLSQRQPERVTLSELQKLYRRVTDVRQDETLRDRIGMLVSEGPFEPVENRMQVWKYSGGGD